MATIVSRPIASALPPFDPPSPLTSRSHRPPLSGTNTASSTISSSLSDAGIAQKWEQRSQQPPSAGPITVSRLRSPSSSTKSSNQPIPHRHRRATSVSSAHASSTLSSDLSPSSFVHAPNRPLLLYDTATNTSDPVLKPRKKSSASGVRPFFKRITSSDSPTASLDLSRSAADQESGLGIYSSDLPSPDPTGEVVFSQGPSRGYHARSTSGASQYSTVSGQHRPYGTPLRPPTNTRPFTPPIAHSYAPSILDSEYSGEAPLDEAETRSRVHRARTHSSPSTPPLRIQTSTSRLGQSHNMSPSIMDPPTPGSAKASSVFKIRKADPILQAETVEAARAAFEAHEREKEEKLEKEATKAAERKERKRARTNSRSKAAFADGSAGSVFTGDEVLAGKEYSQFQAPTDLPQTKPPQTPLRRMTRRQSHSKPSTWARFTLWLKMRVMKMKRRMGM